MNFRIFTSKKTILLVFFCAAILIGALNISPAHAQDDLYETPGETPGVSEDQRQKIESGAFNLIGWIASEALQGTVWFIVYLIGYITGSIFYLGGLLISFALEINAQVINMSVVRTGWALTRDVANLGFVLGILVIAFATIIDYRPYNFQSLFKKFIITAVLINFSLVIAGIILDFTGILTAHFATLGLGQDQNFHQFSMNLASVTQINTLLHPETDALERLGATFSVQIFSLIFIVVFTVLAAIAFVGIAIMFITRFIYLAGLLIMAPLAWFTGIFPGMDFSRRWWKSFLSWSFFAPISMFFLYLSIAFLTDSNNNIQTVNNASQGIMSNLAGVNEQLASSGALTQTLSQIGTMIVTIGFLYASLIVGQKLGVTGAGMAIGWADKAKKWGIKHTASAAGAATARAGRATVRGTAGQFFTEERMREWGEKGNFLKKLIAKPGMRLAEATAASKAAKRYESEVKAMDKDKLAFEHQTALIDPAKRASILKRAIDEGNVGDFKHLTVSDLNTLKTYFGEKYVKKLGSLDPTLSKDYLEAKTPEEKEQALRQAITNTDPEDMAKWKTNKILKRLRERDKDKKEEEKEEKAFLRVLGSLTPRELSQITRGSLADRREVVNRIIKQKAKDLNIDFKQTEDAILTTIAKKSGKKAAIKDNFAITKLISNDDISNFVNSEEFQIANSLGQGQTTISSWLKSKRMAKGHKVDTITFPPFSKESEAAYLAWDQNKAQEIINKLNNKEISDFVLDYKTKPDYMEKSEHLRLVDASRYLTAAQKQQIKKDNPELFDYISQINTITAKRKGKAEKPTEEEKPETPPAPAPPPPTTP